MPDISIGRLLATLELNNSSFTKGMGEARTEAQSTTEKLNRVSAELSGLTTEGTRAASSVQEVGAQLAHTGESAHTAAAGGDDFERSLRRIVVQSISVYAAVQLVERGVRAVSSAITDTGQAAITFETGMTGVTKTVGGTAEQIQGISDDLRQLSRTEIPVTIDEMLKLAQTGGELGVKPENIVAFTAVIAKLGLTTNLTGEAGATMLARFANITHVDQQSYDHLASAIVGLGNDGAGTEQDILQMGLRLAGSADVAGVSAPKILGLANAMSQVGLEAEAGGTAVSTALADMATAAAGSTSVARQKLEDLATVAGETTSEMRTRIKTDAVGAFTDVLAGIESIRNRGGDVFGVLATLGFDDVRQRDAILRAAGNIEEFNRQIANGQTLYDDNRAAQAEFATGAATTASKAKIAENAFHDLQISLGDPFKDALAKLAVAFTDNANNSGSLADSLKNDLQPELDLLVAKLIPLMKQFTEELPAAIRNTKKELQDTIALFGAFGAAIDKINNFGPKVGGNDQQLPTPGGAGVMVRNAIIGAANGNPDFTDKGYPKNGQAPAETPTSANTIVSGGMVVLKSDAERRLAEAEEANRIYQEAIAAEAAAAALAANPPPEPAPGREGAEPETKEAREARLKAAAAAAAEAKREAERLAREAKQAADQAAREAERLAQQHADLLAQFSRVSTEGAGALTPEVGKFAAQVGAALSAAFEPGAAGSQGAALAKSVSDLINQATTAGVPEAATAGAAIKAAMLQALSTHSDTDRAAATALVNNLQAEISAQSALTTPNFGRALGQAQERNSLGSEGAGLLEGLKQSATQGTPEALQQSADALASIQRQLLGNNDLTPDQVSAYWDRIMAAVTTAIDDGGEEARTKLADTIRELNVEQLLDVAGNVLSDRIQQVSEQGAKAITDAGTAAQQQMDQATQQLQTQRLQRADRQNVTDTQASEIQPLLDRIEGDRLALQNRRQDQGVDRSRARQDQQDELQYQRSLQDLKDRAAQHGDTASVGGNARLQEAAAQGIRTGPVNDPMAQANQQLKDLEKQHQRKLDDLKEERSYEDTQRDLSRAEAATDRGTEKGWALEITNFRKIQAGELQRFEDTLADQQLKLQAGPGGRIEQERDARIVAIRAQYTETEAKAMEQFNRDLARQLTLRNFAPGGAGEQATREQLTGQFNAARAMLGLPEMTSPFTAGSAAAGTPTQTQTAQAMAIAAGHAGVGSGPTNNNYYAGPVIGTLEPAASALGRASADREDTTHAVTGQ